MSGSITSKGVNAMRNIITMVVIISLIFMGMVPVSGIAVAQEEKPFILQKWADIQGGRTFAMAGDSAYVLGDDGVLYKSSPSGKHDLVNAIHEKTGLSKVAVTQGSSSYIGILKGSYGGSGDVAVDIYRLSGSLFKTIENIYGYYMVAYGGYFYVGTTDGLKKFSPFTDPKVVRKGIFKKIVKVSGGIIGLSVSGFVYIQGISIKGEGTISQTSDNVAAWVDGNTVYVIKDGALVKTSLSGGYPTTISKLPFDVDVFTTYLMKTDKGFVVVSQGGVYFSEDGKQWETLYNMPIRDIDYDGDTLYILASDGIYTLRENVPLSVDVNPVNMDGDIHTVSMNPPTIMFTNKESQGINLTCTSDKEWLKPDTDNSQFDIASGGSGKVVFRVDIEKLKENWPGGDSATATIQCTGKTADGKKEKSWQWLYHMDIPQITVKMISGTTTISGDPHVSENEPEWEFKVENRGGTYDDVRCFFRGEWAQVSKTSLKIYPGKSETFGLILDPQKMGKTSTGTLICTWIGGEYRYDLTYIRTDLLDVNVKLEVPSPIEFIEMGSVQGSRIVIENQETDEINVECSADAGWLLPDVFSATVEGHSEKSIDVMLRPSAIQNHWPSTATVGGGYECRIEKMTASGSVSATMTLETKKIIVKLPQLSFQNLYTYDINVGSGNTIISVVRVKNQGAGKGRVSCTTDVSWAVPKDVDIIGAGQQKDINISFDYDAMPKDGMFTLRCDWDGGTYSGSFYAHKVAQEPTITPIITDIPIYQITTTAVEVATVDGDALQIKVSADKPFVKVTPSQIDLTGASQSIYISMDSKLVKVSDIGLPSTPVNITLSWVGADGETHERTIGVNIVVKSVVKLYLPKDHMERSFERWSDGMWQKKEAPDSAPFINPLYGRTYVPLRLVSEELGLQVGWDGKNRLITLENDDVKIVLDVKKVVKKIVKLFGKKETLYESTNHHAIVYDKSMGAAGYGRSVYVDPTVIYRGRSYVPVRFIAETVKSLVVWDGHTRTVWIYR